MITRRRLFAAVAAAAVAHAFGGRAYGRASARGSSFTIALSAPEASAATSGAWITFPVVRVRSGFDLVGLGWRSGRPPDAVEIRSRTSTGGWSGWTALPLAPAHAPDDGMSRRTSEPVWTGRNRHLQVRARGRGHGLHAALVRIDRRPAVALAAGASRIVTRSEWGADAVPPRGAPEFGEVHAAFIHHTANANDYTPDEVAGMVLAIARFHRDHNGWNDIGYGFLVDRFGRVYEGRAGGVDQAVVGAHTQGWNAVSAGIAVLGTFGDDEPPAAALDGLTHLLAWKLGVHAVPPEGQVTLRSAGGSSNRYPRGTDVTFERIAAHRDANSTECPGDMLYAELPSVRERTAALPPGVPLAATAPTVLTAYAASRRIRAAGRGVLVRGTREPDGPVIVAVERRGRGGRFHPTRSIAGHARSGRFALRVRLMRPGLYRLVAHADAISSSPMSVRAVKRR